MMQTTKNMPN